MEEDYNILSNLSHPNPSSTDSSRTMNSPQSHQPEPEFESQESPDLIGEGEEEEGECGFCLYMKAGGCRETFTDWEKCVDEGEKNKEDIAEKCFQATSALRMCMEAHSDYYAPLLEAEKAAVMQLAAEKEVQSTATDGEELRNKSEELDDSEKKVAS